MPEPSRGDIWLVDFNPTRGREQAGVRPAVIVSVDEFNHGPAGLLAVLPLTTKDKRIPLHVPVIPPEGGLNSKSFVKCEDIRTITKERLISFLGKICNDTLEVIEGRLRLFLNL
ncbi:MAG: type II toxin-antitoxin system PemK/MazF family toxin [Candidatus Eremiobacterota bacterium]